MPSVPLAAYWDRDAAVQAVRLARPMLDAALSDTGVGESGFLHVVVMNPLAKPGGCDFADAILYEESIGNPEEWDADYGAFARGKARLSWRTGLPSHEVVALKPHLLQAKDGTVWGSVCLDGIVVGVSGANPWFDEAFATAVAALFKAVVHGRRDEEMVP
ncbi:GAF domain-containing protein [Bordetella tumbae]|uniref:hypothetical protein n=1 Tax=Bordetella tumbae TaxID=1649139 RepID=UPI0039EE153E